MRRQRHGSAFVAWPGSQPVLLNISLVDEAKIVQLLRLVVPLPFFEQGRCSAGAVLRRSVEGQCLCAVALNHLRPLVVADEKSNSLSISLRYCLLLTVDHKSRLDSISLFLVRVVSLLFSVSIWKSLISTNYSRRYKRLVTLVRLYSEILKVCVKKYMLKRIFIAQTVIPLKQMPIKIPAEVFAAKIMKCDWSLFARSKVILWVWFYEKDSNLKYPVSTETLRSFTRSVS